MSALARIPLREFAGEEDPGMFSAEQSSSLQAECQLGQITAMRERLERSEPLHCFLYRRMKPKMRALSRLTAL